jgi:hypothetical protein
MIAKLGKWPFIHALQTFAHNFLSCFGKNPTFHLLFAKTLDDRF